MQKVNHVIFTCPLSNILIKMQILDWVIASRSIYLFFAKGCHILVEIIIFWTVMVIIMCYYNGYGFPGVFMFSNNPVFCIFLCSADSHWSIFLTGINFGGKKIHDLRYSVNYAVNFPMCGKIARSEQLECEGLFSPWEKQLCGHDVYLARLVLDSKKQSYKCCGFIFSVFFSFWLASSKIKKKKKSIIKKCCLALLDKGQRRAQGTFLFFISYGKIQKLFL